MEPTPVTPPKRPAGTGPTISRRTTATEPAAPRPVRPSSLGSSTAARPSTPRPTVVTPPPAAPVPPPPSSPEDKSPKGKKGGDGTRKLLLIIIAILLLAVIGLGVWFAYSSYSQNKAIEAERVAREAAELTLQQDMATKEFEDLEQEFAGIENPREMIATDSVKMRLTEKYEAARLEVEKLQQELKNTKNKSAKEIEDLRGQIATLRALLKHYIEEIDRLNRENEALRTENSQVKEQNQRLNAQVQETTRQNQNLSERMTLAEKLNVTGVTLTPLNAKGKSEKKVQKAKQLMVTFTIPQNNSTPVGEKTIYMRITTPEGQLLDGGGSFSFEGATLACSAKKSIEYGGEEIAGIRIYYDVRSALNPGSYTVELFADNYRLASRQFTLK